MDNFPFRISWKLDNYESIHADGKIVKDHEVSMQGENVKLTATFSYASNKWEQIIYIRVLPPVVDEKTKIYQEIKKMLSENENKTLSKELQKSINDLIFEFSKSSGSGKDPAENELKKKRKKRK